MLCRAKRQPEFFMAIILFLIVLSMTIYIIFTNLSVIGNNEPDVTVVSGFDKYAAMSKPLPKVDMSTNDMNEQEEIQAKVEEYNNSIPDLTDEDLEPYLVKPALPQTSIGSIDSFFRTSPMYTYSSSAGADTSSLVGQLEAWGINYGTKAERTAAMTQYDEMIMAAIERHQGEYVIPLNLVKAMILQESGGNPSAKGSASGLMQIEYVNNQNFINYGLNTYGETWTADDLLDPEKNIDYGVYVLAGNISHYNGDYLKAVQSYNYSYYSLDKLIKAYGDNWINSRSHMAELLGKSSYGDSLYLEHVFRYFY